MLGAGLGDGALFLVMAAPAVGAFAVGLDVLAAFFVCGWIRVKLARCD